MDELMLAHVETVDKATRNAFYRELMAEYEFSKSVGGYIPDPMLNYEYRYAEADELPF